ncbi:MAG: Lrp/AsnC family transcriptional regulator [Rhizobiaceae bacterium]|nr:Lrp/AsnC family transcriptional regulator [Rhizobiaceae bacterium]
MELTLDKIDIKLLNLLQRDASATNARLADSVGLSPSSCLRRIRRLKASGVIERVVAIVNPAKTGRVLKALVTVELNRHGEQHMQRFFDLVRQEPAVAQAYAVTGDADIALQLRLRDMQEYDELCQRLFQDQTNVARYVTMMIIRTAKDETALPL